jgi:enediyne biosynthesis protein CalE5
MSTQPFDSIRYKAGQRQEWNTTAPSWQDWWQHIEPALQPISDRMMELAAIRPGHVVLDVATGIGEPAVTAARRVGPSGHVIATDISAEMLALGRKRVAALGLQNIDFREMDAEALDLPEKSFDVILCRLGLMFLPDPQGALERMRRLLLPGGRLIAAVWGPAQKVHFARLPMEVAMRELQLPPMPPGMPGGFSLSDANHLEYILTEADFAQVQIEPMMLTLEWGSVEDYVRFQQAVLAPFNAMLTRYPAEQQAKVWQAILEAARKYTTSDGTCRMENELLLASGRRAG